VYYAAGEYANDYTDPGDVYTVQGHVGPAAIEGRYS